MSLRNRSMLPPLILLTTVVLSLPATAAIYVDCDNTSGIEDGTWEHPYQLISSGMTAAVAGDTVLAMPGTYSEYIAVDMHDPGGMNRAAVVMKDGVTLASFAGPDSTVIHGAATEAAVYMDSCGEGTALAGFTITTSGIGWGPRLAVLCRSSSASILDNVLMPDYPDIYCLRNSLVLVKGNTLAFFPPTTASIVFTTGSGGAVVENVIGGKICIDSYSEPSLPLLVESNYIFSETSRPWEDSGVEVMWGTEGDVQIINNTFEGKEVGAKICYGELHGNRFIDCGINVRVLQYCVPRAVINAEANWWGTIDPSEIATKIVDCEDDPEVDGCVDFEPWCLDEDCTETPAPARSWGSIKALYRTR